MNIFAVIRTRGSAWQSSLPLKQQPEWNAHAAFMDALVCDGFVVLGGPLEGTPDVLLVICAANPEEITERLVSDPWTESGLLRIRQITPWTIRLGTLPQAISQ
jgi:hypothetical protein